MEAPSAEPGVGRGPTGDPVQRWEQGRRRAVVALSLAGIALFAASYFLPWWDFALFAPQYPKGLRMVIALTGVGGDVAEVNLINHYIGMGHLDEAATFERTYAAWLLAGLASGVSATALLAGRRFNWVGAVIALGLPIGFVADTMYWMYRFGHELDPRAAIDIPPFTPTMFGTGKVGQFTTWAMPSWGFWVAVAGVALVGLAMWQRARVCRVCPAAATCGATCPQHLLSIPKSA